MGCILRCCFSAREEVEEDEGLMKPGILSYQGKLCGRSVYRRPTNPSLCCVTIVCGLGAAGMIIGGGFAASAHQVLYPATCVLAVAAPAILVGIGVWAAMKANFAVNELPDDADEYQMT